MPFGRIWYEPDGQVKFTSFAQPCSQQMADDVGAILIRDSRVAPGSTFEDVDTEAEMQAKKPRDPGEGNRDKWRFKPGVGIIVDITVPDPPDPDADLMSQIATANTVAELKVALRAVLRRARGKL